MSVFIGLERISLEDTRGDFRVHVAAGDDHGHGRALDAGHFPGEERRHAGGAGRGVGARRALRLDGDDAPVRQGRRDPGDEPASAHGHDDDLRLAEVLGDLEADRTLAGDDERVVERVHEDPPRLFLEPREPGEDLGRSRRLLVDRRAVARGGGALRLARALPHDDEAVDLLEAAAVGERGGMVAGGGGDDAALSLLPGQRGEPREDAARLEAPRLLEQLGLQERAAAEGPPERVRGQERRAVETAGDRGRRGSYIRVYSGPSPPSGGVSRPPFAEMAPHWMQFDAVTSTFTTVPWGLASRPTSYTCAGQRCTHASAISRRTRRSTRRWLGASSRVRLPLR